jgi:DNA-binding PadR family transcriptional regulator
LKEIKLDPTEIVNLKDGKSKKILPAYFTVIQIITRECRHGRVHNTSELRDATGLPKQRLNYWLKRMCEDGIIYKLDKGLYRITESGKRIYDKCERLLGKQLVRIENMHVSYPITGKLGAISVKSRWRRSGLKKSKVWIAKLKDHTVRLIEKDYGYEFQVYVTKVLGTSPYDAYYHARLEADRVALEMEAEGLDIGRGWVSSEPEIAIPSLIASALLVTTGSSQIRTNKGIMNRSKGRGADWEPRDLQQAQRIVDLPDTVDKILDEIRTIKDSLSDHNTRPQPPMLDYYANWRVF